VRARRLDAGEAVSIAIATSRGLAFASDDDDARLAYLALGGPSHAWTLDLIQNAVSSGLLDEATARAAYESLRRQHRFWGMPWR
jgi:predicted nucleic acid-binding protein